MAAVLYAAGKGTVEPDVEAAEDDRNPTGRPLRIAFEADVNDPRDENAIYNSRLSRSASRDSITRSTSISGIPIEFRTLSLQVTEAQRMSREEDIKKTKEKRKAQDTDYFEKLTYHTLSVDEVCQQLNVAPQFGLSGEAVNIRLQRDGKNVFPQPRPNYVKRLLSYTFGGFCSVLWVGVVVFFLCWRPLSNPPSTTNLALAILVLIVIALQVTFSAFQDWSTARVMSSIQHLLPSEARVLRDGKLIKIPATDLVAGDIVHISIGDKVPADLRLIQTSGDVRFDRAVLTGESDEIDGAITLTDNNFLETRNIAFMGTSVANGNAVGVVVLTGARSVMGRIASATSNVKSKPTLIQQEISRFVKIIVGLTVILASAILFTWVGWLRIKHYAFMTVVAMLNDVMGCVVAFIPEGMPVGVALTLMTIAKRMKKVNVLPKGLSTVETLGCVNVLCSDKTGTLTMNKMFVRSIGFVDKESTADGTSDEIRKEDPPQAARELHEAAILCNDAEFDPVSMHLPISERNIHGNATDGAVLRFAENTKCGDAIREAKPRLFTIAFNSKNKFMVTVHRDTPGDSEMQEGQYLVYVKGAPDILLPRCTSYWSAQLNEVRPLDTVASAQFTALQQHLSRRAERVILVCRRRYTPTEAPGSNHFGDEIMEKAISDLIIIGVFGIIDPPRPETAATVAACRRAGIRFFMVTGDFGLTATAIARSVGIVTGDAEPDTPDNLAEPTGDEKGRAHPTERSLVIEGSQMSALRDADWDAICQYKEIVFARTTPEQKLRIVEEFQHRDNVVAVTGDGVNDAPALRAADVGVAVVSGSDVAVEAADLVLLDKFDSIVEAIRLGRLVFQNLQKLIGYLLPAGSFSEITPVILNVFFGVPLPLSSFLMIIICIFTDLFLSLSLIMEKEEFDLLELPPRNHKKDHLINLRIYGQSYLFVGVMETIIAHAMFFYYMSKQGFSIGELFFVFERYDAGFKGYTSDQLAHFNSTGQCIYFVTLVILQWGNILSIRNKRLSILQADPVRKERRNPYLFGGILISLVIAIFVTEVRGIQKLFGTASVPIEFWLVPIPLALGILVMDEIRKLLVRSFPKSIVARVAW